MMDLITEDCKYAVFDDVDWDGIKRNYKAWMGCQKSFVSTDKYRHKKLIQWGKPCIFLFNHLAYKECDKNWDKDWVEDRCVIWVNYSRNKLIPT